MFVQLTNALNID